MAQFPGWGATCVSLACLLLFSWLLSRSRASMSPMCSTSPDSSLVPTRKNLSIGVSAGSQATFNGIREAPPTGCDIIVGVYMLHGNRYPSNQE